MLCAIHMLSMQLPHQYGCGMGFMLAGFMLVGFILVGFMLVGYMLVHKASRLVGRRVTYLADPAASAPGHCSVTMLPVDLKAVWPDAAMEVRG